ncbi:MAG: hypothetical protein D6713_00480 [Deltaproteobacteria bacterium]|nr:MAG: hypothetical protein D6713_00480 [Deltaproteobacteria bacterium]
MTLFFYAGPYRKYFWLIHRTYAGRPLLDENEKVLLVTDEYDPVRLSEVLFTQSLFGGRDFVVFSDLEDLKGEIRDFVRDEVAPGKAKLTVTVIVTVREERGKGKKWWEKAGVSPVFIDDEMARREAEKKMEEILSNEGVELPEVLKEYITHALPDDPRSFLTEIERFVLTRKTCREESETTLRGDLENTLEREIQVFDELKGFLTRRSLRSYSSLTNYLLGADEGKNEVLRFFGAVKWYLPRVLLEGYIPGEDGERLLSYLHETELRLKRESSLPSKSVVLDFLVYAGGLLLKEG